ncbi:hypothetical protein MRB53_014094 [Persea americana]|uniref:Uncharacterized protein n=1 Tax=Persea americana TaxID=3435 RepID=A0ACC2KAG7_PERAE|nr:hypothetical protein MRB53_014094 [Persea americana]
MSRRNFKPSRSQIIGLQAFSFFVAPDFEASCPLFEAISSRDCQLAQTTCFEKAEKLIAVGGVAATRC